MVTRPLRPAGEACRLSVSVVCRPVRVYLAARSPDQRRSPRSVRHATVGRTATSRGRRATSSRRDADWRLAVASHTPRTGQHAQVCIRDDNGSHFLTRDPRDPSVN